MLASWNTLVDGWGTSLAILVGGALFGWLAKTLLFRRLRELSRRTPTRTDDLLVEATGALWLPAVVVASAIPALAAAPLDERHLGRVAVAQSWLVAAIVALVTWGCMRFVALWFAERERAPGAAATSPSLIAKASRGAVLLVGLLIVLQNVGFAITPLLTALGVGSLAVGLALQPTLSNFFAGIYLSMSKPIRVGDFIELDDGTQGEVVDIGWRATKVRQLANNLAIVPNSRLGEMRILNFSMPETSQSAIVRMGVAYDSDLRRVERLVVEVARRLQRDVPEADPGWEPTVRFLGFGDSSIDFNVALRAREVTDRPTLVHEFVKRVKESFDAEGIEIPYPQRVVHLPAGAPPAVKRGE